jgi:hypothetical protein
VLVDIDIALVIECFEATIYSVHWHSYFCAIVRVMVWNKCGMTDNFLGTGTQRSTEKYAGLLYWLWACRCKSARWACQCEMGTGWQELQYWVRKTNIYRSSIDLNIHNIDQ